MHLGALEAGGHPLASFGIPIRKGTRMFSMKAVRMTVAGLFVLSLACGGAERATPTGEGALTTPSPTPTQVSPTPSPTQAEAGLIPSSTPTQVSPTPSPTQAEAGLIPSPTPTQVSPTPSPTQAEAGFIPSPTPTQISPTPTRVGPTPVEQAVTEKVFAVKSEAAWIAAREVFQQHGQEIVREDREAGLLLSAPRQVDLMKLERIAILERGELFRWGDGFYRLRLIVSPDPGGGTRVNVLAQIFAYFELAIPQGPEPHLVPVLSRYVLEREVMDDISKSLLK